MNPLILKGSATTARIFANNIDYETIKQVKTFCDHPIFENAPIRIMPDTHAGVNSVVGFSAPINRKKEIIPNILGGDIGCGMLCIKLKTQKPIDFNLLDNIIRNTVNISRNIQIKINKRTSEFIDFISQICSKKYKQASSKSVNELGTLGGGNHFIEIDKASNNDIFMVLHSGSRQFGKEVANYHQQIANQQNPYKIKSLSYLSGDLANDYLKDLDIAVEYSKLNRRLMADKIIKQMGWDEIESFESVHNYIANDGIIRKGAIKAAKGNKMIIPLNMRDGALIGIGKGNSDWNNTAPHGAGRKFKRSEASGKISLEEFKKSMENIYSSGINSSHIDESPLAYKDSGEILDNITETADVTDIITPLFNYKS